MTKRQKCKLFSDELILDKRMHAFNGYLIQSMYFWENCCVTNLTIALTTGGFTHLTLWTSMCSSYLCIDQIWLNHGRLAASLKNISDFCSLKTSHYFAIAYSLGHPNMKVCTEIGPEIVPATISLTNGQPMPLTREWQAVSNFKDMKDMKDPPCHDLF